VAAPAPSLAPGTLLGAFRIVRFIARGGMGEVYEAENTITGSRRALKVVRSELLGDADMRARFVRETALASHIKHPNVVEAWDPMLENGSVVLPMELLEGESLAERLSRAAPLDIDEALGIAAAIADGVAAFHERGVIHRDLKPGNVFLARTAGGLVPKVLDFGAARVLGDERQTITGHVVGSPAYMAPEQAMAARDLDGRVDVYALGVILYAMLTGRRPYESDEQGSAIAKLIQRRGFTPLEVLRSSTDEQTRALVSRALAWERDARWPSMRELGQALRVTLASRVGAAPRDSLTAPSVAPALPGADHTREVDARAALGSPSPSLVSPAPPNEPAPLSAIPAGRGDTSSVRLPVRSSFMAGLLALGVLAGVAVVVAVAIALGAAGPWPGRSPSVLSASVDAAIAHDSRTDAGPSGDAGLDAGLDAAIDPPDAHVRRTTRHTHEPSRGLWLDPEPSGP
jgi:serine/threonine protein kinase